MIFQKSSHPLNSQNREQAKEVPTNTPLQSSQLMQLFVDQLKDIYWAEKAITKAIPEMIIKATSHELIDELTSHHLETQSQITRVEQVFESLGKKVVAKKCDAMEGLIKEAEEIIASCEAGAMCDAGIIVAVQKIEHYEIASYGTLCVFARTLGEDEAVELLEDTLEEEKDTNEILSEIAQSINLETTHDYNYL